MANHGSVGWGIAVVFGCRWSVSRSLDKAREDGSTKEERRRRAMRGGFSARAGWKTVPSARRGTRTESGLRGEENLIAAEPADARGIAGDLEPIVVLVEDAKFCAV